MRRADALVQLRQPLQGKRALGGQTISNNTARTIEVLTTVALVCFAIAFPLTRAVTVIENASSRGWPPDALTPILEWRLS